MKVKTGSIKGVVFALYSIVVFALLIMPKLKYTVTYGEISIISLPLVTVACFLDASILKKTYPILINLLFMALFRALFNTWGDLTAAINMSFVLYLGLLGYFLFEATQKMSARFVPVILVVAVLAMFLTVGIKTFIELAENPGITRLLARGGNDDEELHLLRMKNIGGFGFSYAVGMLTPYVATLIIRFKGIKRVVLIGVLAALFVYIFNAQYTTLLILSVAFTMLVFLMRSKSIYTKLTIFVLTIVVLLSLKYIFLFLAENIKLTALANHFEDLYVTLSGGDSSSSRGALQSEAFKLFFKYPIFGANLNDATNNYIVAHSHTVFSALLASGGIVGTLLYYGCLYLSMLNIKRAIPTFTYIAPVFLYLFVLSIMNPTNHFEILIAVYFIVPTIELLINRREEKKIYEQKTPMGN